MAIKNAKKISEPETPQNASGRTKIPHRGHSPLRRSTQKQRHPRTTHLLPRKHRPQHTPRKPLPGDSRTTHPHPANRLARLQAHVRHRHTARRTRRGIHADLWDRKTVLNTHGPFLILDRVSDPGNLGVIMRTAEAAGCNGIFLTRGSVEVYNPKVVRATMGTIFRLPVFPLQDGPALLHSTPPAQHPDHRSTHQRRTPFHKLQPQKPVALLLGNEAFGIDPALLALSDHTVTIPMTAPVESLNIAVATGILLYQINLSQK